MCTRREFLRHGTLLPALATIGPAALTGDASGLHDERDDLGGRNRPDLVLYDGTSKEGLAFGAAAARRGTATLRVAPALGTAWVNEIEPRLKQAPLLMAGLTDGPSLFCLELLCRDYGMGLVYRTGRTGQGTAADLLDLSPRRGTTNRSLYSWVIAPVDRPRFC
jgi:hypothetical protein